MVKTLTEWVLYTPDLLHTLSKYDCFIFSIHLDGKIRNNIFIQINHQVFAPT